MFANVFLSVFTGKAFWDVSRTEKTGNFFTHICVHVASQPPMPFHPEVIHVVVHPGQWLQKSQTESLHPPPDSRVHTGLIEAHIPFSNTQLGKWSISHIWVCVWVISCVLSVDWPFMRELTNYSGPVSCRASRFRFLFILVLAELWKLNCCMLMIWVLSESWLKRFPSCDVASLYCAEKSHSRSDANVSWVNTLRL